MKEEKRKKNLIQLIKFGLIGTLNTFIDLVVTMLLNGLFGIYYVVKIIGYSCGIANSYICNSRWTFKEEHKRDKREVLSFIIVNVITIGLSLLLLWITKDLLHLGDWWIERADSGWISKIIDRDRFCVLLTFPIPLLLNFAGNKLFVFREKRTEMGVSRNEALFNKG